MTPVGHRVEKDRPFRHLLLPGNHQPRFVVMFYVTFNYIVNVLSFLGSKGQVQPQTCVAGYADHHTESVRILRNRITEKVR